MYIVIYEALRFDVAQGRMNGVPKEEKNVYMSILDNVLREEERVNGKKISLCN